MGAWYKAGWEHGLELLDRWWYTSTKYCADTEGAYAIVPDEYPKWTRDLVKFVREVPRLDPRPFWELGRMIEVHCRLRPDIDNVPIDHADIVWACEMASELKDALYDEGIIDQPAEARTDKINNSLPSDDVYSCAQYIVQQRKLIASKRRPNAVKRALIAEHLGHDDTGAMERALQPSRFGWLISDTDRADK